MRKSDRRDRRRFLFFTGGVLLATFGAGCASSPPSPHVLTPHRLCRFQHANRVTSLSWSPDSRHFVSGSWDTTVRIWNIVTRKQVLAYSGPGTHTQNVTCVAWSFDGFHIASGSWENIVKIWNAATGRPVTTYQFDVQAPGAAVGAVAWSNDNRYVAAGGNGHQNVNRQVKIWDTSTGENTKKYLNQPPKNVHTVAWSPDGKYIVSGSDSNNVYVQDINNTDEPIYVYKKHQDSINCLAWVPAKLGTSYIASGSGDYGRTPLSGERA